MCLSFGVFFLKKKFQVLRLKKGHISGKRKFTLEVRRARTNAKDNLRPTLVEKEIYKVRRMAYLGVYSPRVAR